MEAHDPYPTTNRPQIVCERTLEEPEADAVWRALIECYGKRPGSATELVQDLKAAYLFLYPEAEKTEQEQLAE
jgi:hypothetical protein